MNKINLGDKVRSKVSGFSGTVTAICHYLHSESQYCVKSNALVDLSLIHISEPTRP